MPPSTDHEVLLLLFRNRPTLVTEFLPELTPSHDRIHFAPADVGEPVATEFRADQVIVLEESGKPVVAFVLEAQLQPDTDKHFTWPHYLTGIRARLRCAAVLVVITTTPEVARWAAKPIDLGRGMVLRPVVIGPQHVPHIVDVDAARRAPELAVLSVLAHKAENDIVDIAVAAATAALDLDEARARLYDDVIRKALSDDARFSLEAMMATSGYQYPQSEFARKHHGEGVREGIREGNCKGRQQSLLRIFTARGFAVDALTRERIESCTDQALLDEWVERAVTAENLDDVFHH